MNYVNPIVGKWYQLHNKEDESGGIQPGDIWIVMHTEDVYRCPYIFNNTFYPHGGFNRGYRYTEVTPDQVNPYVPQEYKIKQEYEIY